MASKGIAKPVQAGTACGYVAKLEAMLRIAEPVVDGRPFRGQGKKRGCPETGAASNIKRERAVS